MEDKYNIHFENEIILKNIHKLVNLTYKLLPTREEGSDWEKPLQTIIEELAGMDRVLLDQHDILFPLLCKMEGLFSLTAEYNFSVYRRTIFECISLLDELKKRCLD